MGVELFRGFSLVFGRHILREYKAALYTVKLMGLRKEKAYSAQGVAFGKHRMGAKFNHM